MENFNVIINKLESDYQETLQRNSGEAFSKLSTIFEELGMFLREHIQDLTGDDMRRVVQQLKTGEKMSPQDVDLLRLWIVGDAEYYTKLENDYHNWLCELERIMGEIRGLKNAKADVEHSSRLRALFRDGSRVLADVFYYLQQKDRIQRFKHSTEELDDQERQVLINLLEQKLKSQDF